MYDIYFDEKYCKLYEKIESGIYEKFFYSSSLGEIEHIFIKREIPINYEGKIYYDLITPYGYGGPIITKLYSESKTALLQDFNDKFKEFCIKNNIVSEFVRFHPIVKNAEDFKNIYNISHIRNTVGTDLVDNESVFKEQFSKSCRKNINKAKKNGIKYEVIKNPDYTDVMDFTKIYYSTMDRNSANGYYYFEPKYFEDCLTSFSENIVIVKAIYDNIIIAMGFYFVYKKMIHIHLSGTLSEYLYLSPAYILRYAITEWGINNGYELIHHGGGRSNDSSDGLFKFKRQFGTMEFAFCIGKKIWNESLYKYLCDYNGINYDTEYFPAYRDRKKL